MNAQKSQDTGIFYGLGRGIFIALLVFTLPAIGVVYYYNHLEKWTAEFADLPVFDQWQQDFHVGQEAVGALFAENLRRYYLLDTLQASTDEADSDWNSTGPRYWSRNTVEDNLSKQLSRGKQRNVAAYLDYIQRYRGIALAEMKRTRVPASVTLAQGLLESDAGRGFLPMQANNHFGVKCKLNPNYKRDGKIADNDFNYTGLAVDCIQRADDYEWDRFEVYASASQSFRRHGQLLRSDRYRWMIESFPVGEMCRIERPLYGLHEVPYYAAWCVGLKQSGYATAPKYAEALAMIIETYQLWKIDYELIRSI